MSQSLFAEEIIPRKELFKTAEIIAVKVSPKQNCKAYLKSQTDGTLNLFVEQKQMTFFKEPSIQKFFWSSDEKHLIFLKDIGGGRDFHIMGVNVETSKIKDYTAGFERVLGKIYGTSHDKAAIGIAGENPLYHDVYFLNLSTGELKLHYANERFAKFWFDENLNIALKAQVHPNGAMTFVDAQDRVFMELSPEDAFHTTPLLVYGNACYLLDTRTSDTTTLMHIDLNTRKQTMLAHDHKSDIQQVIFDKGNPLAYSLCHTHTTWHALAPEVESDLQLLTQKVGSEFGLMSQEGDHWIVRSTSPIKGINLYHYNRAQKNLERLSQHPHIEGLLDMRALVIPSRDGYDLVSYLTLPKEQTGPLPLVLIPHGGPFQARDSYCFNPYHQWLASRGYAVLSVNFRSSSGFGKNFVCVGNGEWGGKAQEDLIDAAQWCIKQGIAEKEKVAIFGGSYGGYAGLAGLAFTPDFFAGAVAICGPSNLKTVLDKVPLYWETPTYLGSDSTSFFTKGAFVANMGGNPDEKEGAEFLHSRSPLNFAHEINKPLLLVHGSNDPIVAQSESDQIFEAMKTKGMPLTYLVFPDEGHGFSKFSNQMVSLAYSEKFLAEILGGYFEELTPKDKAASSVTIQQVE